MANEPARPDQSNGPRRLTAKEEATAAELGRIDPELAGLFERGLRLADEIDSPGVRCLVGQVGRELSRGIVSALTGEMVVTPDAAEEEAREDRFRANIARVLEVAEGHPNVSAWFRSHNALVGAAHWRRTPPSADVVRESFATLVDLLFGRVAPYFDTQAELDQLLTIELPTDADAARLRRCTLRYTQRRYFFSRVSNARWLQPLATAGFFQSAPDRVNHPDGSWSIQQWPEGDALARLAGHAPDLAIRPVPRDAAEAAPLLADASDGGRSATPTLVLLVFRFLRLAFLASVLLPSCLGGLPKHLAPRLRADVPPPRRRQRQRRPG